MKPSGRSAAAGAARRGGAWTSDLWGAAADGCHPGCRAAVGVVGASSYQAPDLMRAVCTRETSVISSKQ